VIVDRELCSRNDRIGHLTEAPAAGRSHTGPLPQPPGHAMSLLRLLAALVVLVGPGAVQPAVAQNTMTMAVCPIDYSGFPADAPTLTCDCSAAAVKDGSVIGANPYSRYSSVCRAALHAGAIGPQGGTITVTPIPNQPFFPGVEQNGVR